MRKRYRQYLSSSRWRALRARALEAAGYVCENCLEGSTPFNPLELHHVDYSRLYEERPVDLVVLCRACHRETHRGALFGPSRVAEARARRRDELGRAEAQIEGIFG